MSTDRDRRSRLPHGPGLWIALAITLVIGLQLGRLPWRYRQQILQLQGAVVGGAVGFVIGRFSR